MCSQRHPVLCCSKRCQKEQWSKYTVLCNVISNLATQHESKDTGSYASHVTLRAQAKLVKLVGDKYKDRWLINNLGSEFYNITCA